MHIICLVSVFAHFLSRQMTLTTYFGDKITTFFWNMQIFSKKNRKKALLLRLGDKHIVISAHGIST